MSFSTTRAIIMPSSCGNGSPGQGAGGAVEICDRWRRHRGSRYESRLTIADRIFRPRVNSPHPNSHLEGKGEHTEYECGKSITIDIFQHQMDKSQPVFIACIIAIYILPLVT